MCTKDCPEILAQTLPLLLWADEIVIVDVSITNDVRELVARISPDIRYIKSDVDDFLKRYLSIAPSIQSDFVLGVDSDEFYYEELSNEILSELEKPCNISGFLIRANNYFFGSNFGLSHPMLRLFRKDKVNVPLTGSAHLHPTVNGETKVLKNAFTHIDNPKLGMVAVKHFRYSAIMSNRMNDEQLEASTLENLAGRHLLVHAFISLARLNVRFAREIIRNRAHGFAALCNGYQSILRVIAEDVAPTEELRMRQGLVERDNRGYW
jgi:hypothetical protein